MVFCFKVLTLDDICDLVANDEATVLSEKRLVGGS